MIRNTALVHCRHTRGWSQNDLAAALDVAEITVRRWELGLSIPSYQHLSHLRQLFHASVEQLGWYFHPTHRTFQLIERDTFLPSPQIMKDVGTSLPTLLIGRADERIAFKRWALTLTSSTRLVLEGLPGVGKTALAFSLLSDPDLRISFDGVLYARAGQRPDFAAQVIDWCCHLGISRRDISTQASLARLIQILRQAMGPRRFLIILDDVWHAEDVHDLALHLDHLCRMVITTRSPRAAIALAREHIQHITPLTEEESLTVLRLQSSIPVHKNTLLLPLVRTLGGLPLGLLLMGLHLRTSVYTGSLRRFHLLLDRLLHTPYRLSLSTLPGETPYTSMQAALEPSIAHLPVSTRQALYRVAHLPTRTFGEHDVQGASLTFLDELDHLCDNGLIEINAHSRYHLHTVIADYARVFLTPAGNILSRQEICANT